MISSFRFLLLIVLFTLMANQSSRGIDVSWKPVSATSDHTIDGSNIVVASGGNTITLELRISNWGDDNGGNTLLHAYQVNLDLSGFTSGQSGSLELAKIPCSNDSDCFSTLTCGRQTPGICDTFIASIHPAVFIDGNHPSYPFLGFEFGTEVIHGVRVTPDEIQMAAIVLDSVDSVADTGSDVYGGTIILDVSEDALGIFKIDLILEFVNNGTIFLDENSLLITPVNMTPAQIIVSGDCNFNGRIDYEDIIQGSSSDCNNNFLPDDCETDCNFNRIPDDCDITSGASEDCNNNKIPDECDSDDCNDNQIPDSCDIQSNFSADVNTNFIPDECEDDCNGNGIPDTYDLTLSNAEDCNNNFIPDSCDLIQTPWLDCNENGFIDDCDIADGFSPDLDGNCIPDECLQRPRPAAELAPLDKSRYIAFTPTRAGCLSAIRITLRSLYHPDTPITNQPDFSVFEGEIRWVGPPNVFPESAAGVTAFTAAQLQCEPFFGDWDSVDIVHVYGDAILPNSLYEVQMVGSDCFDENDTACHSGPLQIFTGQWCDVAPPYSTPFGSSQPDIADVLAVTGKWLGSVEPGKVFAQLQPNVPDPSLSVGISDVLVAVDAWLGSAYPYTGPTSCPP